MGPWGARVTGISLIRRTLLAFMLVIAVLAGGAGTALAGDVVYVAPGTDAPPATLGPYEVEPLSADGAAAADCGVGAGAKRFRRFHSGRGTPARERRLGHVEQRIRR